MVKTLLTVFLFCIICNSQAQPSVSNTTIINPTCNGGNNGSIAYQIAGGPGPIHYVWSNGDSGTATGSCTYAVQLNNPGNALSQFQIEVDVNIAPGMNANFSNIVFIDSLGNNIPFWLKDFPTDSTAIFWVRVPLIPPGNSVIYLSFCGDSTVSGSNPYTTFDFFENFDSGSISNWVTACENIDVAGESCSASVSNTQYYSPPFSMYLYANASCFVPPFDGAISTASITVALVDDSFVVDYDDKAVVNLWGFCTGGTSTTNQVYAHSTSIGNGVVVGQGGSCAIDTGGWKDETSEPFAVTLDTATIMFKMVGGDCDTAEGWFDDIRIRKYVSNPPVVTIDTTPQLLLDSLTAGTYVITLYDINGGSVTDTFTVAQPAPLMLTPDSSNITCFGLINGSAWVTVANGTTPYTYLWSNGQATDTIAGLSAGSYYITVTDFNNCTGSDSVNIIAPLSALAVTVSLTNPTCYNSDNGSIIVNASGGTMPYTYLWNPTLTANDTATGLGAGTYSILVQDTNDCSQLDSAILVAPAQIVLSDSVVPPICHDSATGAIFITVTGGVLPLTFAWSPNASSSSSAIQIAPGSYDVSVTDSNNCMAADSFSVPNPPAIDLNATTGPILCNGQQTGSITVTATGGTPGFSYTAAGATDTLTSASGAFDNVGAGTYTLLAIDQNGCAGDTSVTVNQPPALQDSLSQINNSCSSSDGQIAVYVSGGSAPYAFSFSNGVNNSTGTLANLQAGTYGVTVTDVNGCTVQDSTAIPASDSIAVTLEPTAADVKLGQTLQINTATNQTGFVYYNWIPSEGLSCDTCPDPLFVGIYSGQYVLTVTNLSGCETRASIDITVVPDYTLYFPNVFTPGANGVNAIWQVYGNLEAVKYFTVMLFDRIGEKVFDSNDINFQWDGQYKGHPAQMGVYSYVATVVWLNDYVERTMVGSITLLR